jgi:glutamate/tyrosine decarboxylase-like PLP-dependent enzyme
VSTGAVDPLPELAAFARERGLWFHVDGAYGAPAVLCDEAPDDLRGLALADSVAVDPHKWLYAPLEAGCVLVRHPGALRDAFAYTPPYYHFEGEDEDPRVNFYELGPQNSRGFRALKVWLALQQAGREGYRETIGEDIRLARRLDACVRREPRLEARTLGLSIVTFRYVPEGSRPGTPEGEERLSRLNERLLERLQASGELYLSNAVIDGAFLLRACIVNFRTTRADVEALPAIVVRHGDALVRR